MAHHPALEIFRIAIFDTIPNPLLVLDCNLVVLTANEGFYKQFKVTPEVTTDKNVFELGNRQWDIPELRTLLEKKLPDKLSVKEFIVTHEFPSIGKRTMSLNACEIHSSEFIPLDLILVVFEDVTDKKKWLDSLLELNERLNVTNAGLVKSSEQLRAFSSALTLVEYRERQRFSYVLHENLQQILFGSKMLLRLHLKEHEKLNSPPEQDFEIEESLKLLDKALNITRSMSIELSPPILKTQGLDSALSWIASFMKDSYGLKVNLAVDPEVKNIKNETQLMLTQMVRELLFNVVKHSGVLEANVEATYQSKTIRISVRDYGKGFNIETMQYKLEKGVKRGLFTIEERVKLFGGNMELYSSRGNCNIVLSF